MHWYYTDNGTWKTSRTAIPVNAEHAMQAEYGSTADPDSSRVGIELPPSLTIVWPMTVFFRHLKVLDMLPTANTAQYTTHTDRHDGVSISPVESAYTLDSAFLAQTQLE